MLAVESDGEVHDDDADSSRRTRDVKPALRILREAPEPLTNKCRDIPLDICELLRALVAGLSR